MGPPSEDDGSRAGVGRGQQYPRASMGPPSKDDGKEALSPIWKKGLRLCFNGAAVRGRGESDEDIETNSRAEPLQWGRRPMTTESGPRLEGWVFAKGASMGPPSEDDGKLPCEHASRDLATGLQWGRRPRTTERRPGQLGTPRGGSVCFNGAAVRGRRKGVAGTWRSAWQDRRLQWGRRPRTTESGSLGKSPSPHYPKKRASMGPPSEDDGKVTTHPMA